MKDSRIKAEDVDKIAQEMGGSDVIGFMAGESSDDSKEGKPLPDLIESQVKPLGIGSEGRRLMDRSDKMRMRSWTASNSNSDSTYIGTTTDMALTGSPQEWWTPPTPSESIGISMEDLKKQFDAIKDKFPFIDSGITIGSIPQKAQPKTQPKILSEKISKKVDDGKGNSEDGVKRFGAIGGRKLDI